MGEERDLKVGEKIDLDTGMFRFQGYGKGIQLRRPWRYEGDALCVGGKGKRVD